MRSAGRGTWYPEQKRRANNGEQTNATWGVRNHNRENRSGPLEAEGRAKGETKMHCLEVIIARNDRAAGREAAHADNDWNDREASAILEATFEQAAKEGKSELPEHYVAGFLSGRKEG